VWQRRLRDQRLERRHVGAFLFVYRAHLCRQTPAQKGCLPFSFFLLLFLWPASVTVVWGLHVGVCVCV
jgi:hypothetical protein